MSNTRILLVEDDENVSLLYQQALEREGYDVLRVADGKSAVETAQAEKPDLVVMDINLPENMDGLESMAKILGQDRHIPVIINTGYSEYKDNFMSWAAEAYVLKSADLDPLLNAVRAALQKRGASD